MHRQHLAQDGDVPLQQGPRLADGGNGLQQFPLWLDAKLAAAYVGNKSLKAFYEWRKRHGIATNGMGRVSRRDLDRALRTPRKRRVMNPASLANLRRVKGA